MKLEKAKQQSSDFRMMLCTTSAQAVQSAGATVAGDEQGGVPLRVRAESRRGAVAPAVHPRVLRSRLLRLRRLNLLQSEGAAGSPP